MDRVMCRDQYGGVRLCPRMGVMDALQAIYDLRYHPLYGSWAQRAVCLDRHDRPMLRPPEPDLIHVLDRLCEIEDTLYGPMTVPSETIPEGRRTERCHRCAHFRRSGNTNWGVCLRSHRVRANLCAACNKFERRERT